jgi:hypothetical protein
MRYLVILLMFFACENTTQRIAPEPKIGEEYQGGIVFYIFQSTDVYYIEGEVHGMIASKKDLENTYKWGCLMNSSQFGHKLGDGIYNTEIIVNTCEAPNAATACKDWHLPNIKEFEYLLKIKHLLDLEHTYYWTSSLITSSHASAIRPDGNTLLEHVNYKHKVRPIKRF